MRKQRSKKRSISGTKAAAFSSTGKPVRPSAQMPVINPHAAAVDVGATSHWACVPEDAVDEVTSPVREFGACTRELDALVEWMLKCGVKTVVLESTSVYWIPLFQKLEAAGLEVLLVNAQHVHNVPGRKSDCKDCQWLQRLHSYGLLSGSFRPTDDICRLRTLTRHRKNLEGTCAQQVQLMQKALNHMNIHLHHAVNDLVGETGLRILDAILTGQRDAEELVKLRDPKIIRSTVEEMIDALKGDWREEELFVLGQSLANYRHFIEQIRTCDAELEKVLAQVVANSVVIEESDRPKNPPAADPGPKGKAKRKRCKILKNGTGIKRDLRAELTRVCGVDLTQVAGLNILGVLIIISEIGVDMSRWRSEKAFSSWLGLSPGNKISGGKILSSRTVPVANRVSILLRTVAPAVGRTQTWLGAFHRRMRARLGPAGANTATAHKLACLIYHLLKYKEEYIDVDAFVYQEKLRKSRITKLCKQAEELGFDLVKREAA